MKINISQQAQRKFNSQNPAYDRRKVSVKWALASVAMAAILGILGASVQAQTLNVAYTADPNGTFGGAGNNGGLDIGQKFTVSGSGIVIYSLGVFDYLGNGLNTSHTVALFSGDGSGATLVAGGTVTVPGGTVAPLQDGFRFWPLPSPVTLPAGTYSVIVYQMNGGSGSDGYGQGATGFIGCSKLSNIGTTYNFETAAPPTFPYESSAGNLACCSFTYAPVLASSDYVPVPLSPGSYNQDAIVEAGAPVPPFATSDCTMDSGTGNSGNTWYEIGADSAASSTGIPAHGSTWTSSLLANHSYVMAPDYHVNDVILIDGNVTSNSVTVVTPVACSSLSFLCSSGGGATTFNYWVQHADGTIESGTFSSPDWFTGGAGTAYIANGRVSVGSSPNFNDINGGTPDLYGGDVTLTDTTSPVTSIAFSHNSGSGHGVIFAVSGSTGGAFSPMAITGYNEDMIVEATSEPSLGGHYTTVSMDNGTGNSANSWYEMGFDKQAGITGIPNAGSTIASAANPNHYFTFASSYAGADVGYLDSSHTCTLTPATPGFYSSLSFLTSAGHGPITVNYAVNHADGTSEYGTFSSPDWFNNSPPVAWVAAGRVDVGTTSFANVNSGDPAIYNEDILLSNPNSQVLSISLSTSTGGGQAMVFAVSGVTNAVAATAPYNIAVSPSSLTQYLGGEASFTVTADGTLPFNYQWYQGASLLGGQTNATLTLTGLNAGSAGSYTCIVGNAGGANTSSNAVLTVQNLPSGDPGVVLYDQPLVYYRLNETNSWTVSMAINSGSLGTNDNATNFAGAVHQVPGAIVGDPDTAMGFPGIDTNSDDGGYPTIIPYDPALNPNGSFTVELWLQPNLQGNLGNAQAPMNNDYTDGNGDRFGWDFFQRAASTETPDANGPGYSFRMWNGGNNGTESANLLFNITGGLYTVGTWSHLVAVYDASAQSATLYFNGQQVAQSTSPNGSYAPNPQTPMGIGCYADGTENPFCGQIDEVAIYGTALSSLQVLTHYQNGTNALRSTPYPSVITGDGALEYLRMDEPAINVAANLGRLGSPANGVDSLTGTPVAGPTPPAFPGFDAGNLALAFNGSDYVELGNPRGLNFTGPITLEAWVQPSATQNSFADVLAHGYNDAGTGEVVLRLNGTNTYQISSFDGVNNYGVTAAIPTQDLGTGNWVHLVGTYDGTDWNLYRNGVLAASAPFSTGAVVVSNANWAIGARGRWKYAYFYPNIGIDTEARQFNGAIDEVAIYNYALPASRVEAHYSESMPLTIISSPGGVVTLTWAVGTLQQSANVNGPYANVAGPATSPYQPPLGSQMFYRLQY